MARILKTGDSDVDINKFGIKKKRKTSSVLKKILVVGDWLVDEHWVTGVHRSSSSSRTGHAHYRALHNLESTVQSFCGAGRSASLLYQVKKRGRRLFSIYGLGLWHERDTDHLKEMFDFKRLRGKTLFRLNHDKPVVPEDVELINLLPLLNEEERTKICTT